MESRWQEWSSSLGLLILRVGIGGYMLTHGWGKLQMVLTRDFDNFGDPIGLGSAVSLVLITIAEFLCALLVMFGLATRVAAAVVAIAMGVAAFVVHSGDPWTMGAGASKEPALLYMIGFLTLVFTGAGRFSMDSSIWPRRGEKPSDHETS